MKSMWASHGEYPGNEACIMMSSTFSATRMNFFKVLFLSCVGVYCLGNHPVSRVEIMGYIVSVDIKERLAIYGGKQRT